MSVPSNPKIYHIVHVDRLSSIVKKDGLLSDAQMKGSAGTGTVIGMSEIKQRRLEEITLDSHPSLYVGQCVPFYFCPRSVMLYLIYRSNHPDLTYKGGQGPIIHLEADLKKTIQWAKENNYRWAFTLSNAGSYFFEDRCDLSHLKDIDWKAVQANDWQKCQDSKQAEFLIETSFPWQLIERIGVLSQGIAKQVKQALQRSAFKPRVDILQEWYY